MSFISLPFRLLFRYCCCCWHLFRIYSIICALNINISSADSTFYRLQSCFSFSPFQNVLFRLILSSFVLSYIVIYVFATLRSFIALSICTIHFFILRYCFFDAFVSTLLPSLFLCICLCVAFSVKHYTSRVWKRKDSSDKRLKINWEKKVKCKQINQQIRMRNQKRPRSRNRNKKLSAEASKNVDSKFDCFRFVRFWCCSADWCCRCV